MKYLQTLSVATAFISALSLYYGSLGIPPNIQSYGGETARELAIKKRDGVLKWKIPEDPGCSTQAAGDEPAVFSNRYCARAIESDRNGDPLLRLLLRRGA